MLSASDLTYEDVNRLFRQIDYSGDGVRCHPWTGRTGSDGHGLTVLGRRPTRRSVGAHRVVYVFTHPDEPPLDDDEVVRHSCDNPPCCNGSHLLRGTQADNIADMIERGRGQTPEKLRANQATAAARRIEQWERVDLPRILDALVVLPPPRSARKAERAIPGYSYARHRYGHRRLIEMAAEHSSEHPPPER